MQGGPRDLWNCAVHKDTTDLLVSCPVHLSGQRSRGRANLAANNAGTAQTIGHHRALRFA